MFLSGDLCCFQRRTIGPGEGRYPWTGCVLCRLRTEMHTHTRTRTRTRTKHIQSTHTHMSPSTSPTRVRHRLHSAPSDPYHGARQAHGLCFSVNHGIDVPPSLRNMYKELA